MIRLQDLPLPETGPDEARERAQRVMADFTWGTSKSDNWLAKAAESIAETIGSVLNTLFGSGIVTIVVWALIIAGIGWIVWTVVRNHRPRAKRVKPTVRTVSIEASRPPEEWMGEADDFERRGEWKLGLRARYRAMVSELIAQGHLRDIPGRTTGEFRLELADPVPAARGAFGAATDLFDRAWYGNSPTGAPEAQAFAGHARDVSQLATRAREEREARLAEARARAAAEAAARAEAERAAQSVGVGS